MGKPEDLPGLSLPVAAQLLDTDARTLLFLIEEASIHLIPGPALSIGDFRALARHPDLLADHGLAAHSALADQGALHAREKRVLFDRLAELEQRVASQRAEIESLRRSVLVGCAERDRLLQRRAPRSAS